MPNVAFCYALAFGIEQADAVLRRRPIEADKPTNVISHSSTSDLCRGPPRRLSIPVLALERKPPTGQSVAAVLPGHVSYAGAQGTGAQWWLPADRPAASLHADWLPNAMKGTGCAKLVPAKAGAKRAHRQHRLRRSAAVAPSVIWCRAGGDLSDRLCRSDGRGWRNARLY